MTTSLKVPVREAMRRMSRDVIRITFHEQKSPKRDGTPVFVEHHWDLFQERAYELAHAILREFGERIE